MDRRHGESTVKGSGRLGKYPKLLRSRMMDAARHSVSTYTSINALNGVKMFVFGSCFGWGNMSQFGQMRETGMGNK